MQRTYSKGRGIFARFKPTLSNENLQELLTTIATALENIEGLPSTISINPTPYALHDGSWRFNLEGRGCLQHVKLFRLNKIESLLGSSFSVEICVDQNPGQAVISIVYNPSLVNRGYIFLSSLQRFGDPTSLLMFVIGAAGILGSLMMLWNRYQEYENTFDFLWRK